MAGATGLSFCSPPAWPWHWGTEEPEFSLSVPILGASWEHHWLQQLVQDSFIFSMLFKMKSSLISNYLSTSGGTTLRTLMATLFHCPSVARMTGGQACSSVLVELFAISLFREGFPPTVVSLCRWERGGGLSSPEGCLLGLTRQLGSHAASSPTVAKKPKTISYWNNCLVHFFPPFVSFLITAALRIAGLSLCFWWWGAGQAQC